LTGEDEGEMMSGRCGVVLSEAKATPQAVLNSAREIVKRKPVNMNIVNKEA
jgi:hypothetical protein